MFKASHNAVINGEVQGGYHYVTAGDGNWVAVKCRVGECPVALDDIAQRPTDSIGNHLRPQPVKVKPRIADRKNQVASPKVNAAADNVFQKLQDKLFRIFRY